MFIECLLDINNVALKAILLTYVKNTPFLRIPSEQIPDMEGLLSHPRDLLIIEYDFEYQDIIENLISSLRKQVFMILIDLRSPYCEKLSFENVICVPKNLTHCDFVEALSKLIDRSKLG